MNIARQDIFSESAGADADLRLREFARRLAGLHTVDKTLHPNRDLLKHLQRWEQILRNAKAVFKTSAPDYAQAARAGEWMLDNYYIIKQTFRQIEEGLPASFFEQLPALDGTALQGYPRVFALAWEWIGYSQHQFDLTQAAAFLQNYQQAAPLSIGELWALPIMLRVGVLERLVCAVTELTGMDAWQGFSPSLRQLHAPSLTHDAVVANCFLSLRLLSATDWKLFFEQTSRVEQILRRDPAQVYAGMDFETRNSYRNVIEELARHSIFSEEQIADAAVQFAENAGDPQAAGKKAHVGFYLRDGGRAALESSIRYQPGIRARIRGALLASATAAYLGSIAIIFGLLISGLLAYAAFLGSSPVQLIVIGVLGGGLALESAVALVHWELTHRIKPQSLPRLDFSNGIPPGHRTMVVVPVLLESAAELNHLLQDLELYHLANPEPQLTYALLTDFGDAAAENLPEDERLLGLAITGIQDLNRKYARAAVFYLFHRQRQWNRSEGVWMGWERKRGKLADFNRLLLNLGGTSYTTRVGDASVLRDIRYVITLDADTSLPQNSANRLVATLAHPLNQAEFAADGRSVVAGYTVLQPRMAIKPTSANRSPFSQIFSGNTGFDLYSFAVSDVYQDVFGEGSYVGKGIYDVAAFERSLSGQVRQNTLLSHDLFEGSYGRAALVTDIVLYEEYPSRYLGYARRLSRWIRGDWQLLPWLLPIVRTEKGSALNRLSILNLWKIFDNLRRSLMPATLLALLAAGWLFLPGSPLFWTLLALIPSALPIAAQTAQQVKPNGRRRLTLRQMFEPARLPITRWALAMLFLPYEALLTLGAVGTTLTRLILTRKNLLQWTTAANVSRSFRLNARLETWEAMAASWILSIVLGIAITILNPAALWAAMPFLLAWMMAPHIAYIISRPVTHGSAPLSEIQRRHIRRLARRTWAFFEQFAGPDDHWLPPDHFQESPRGSVAHYTTPTNIGLFLTSTLSAYDFGYIGLSELAVRLRSTFESIDKLEHYRGHLLNWYDSKTLAALPPRYISTVDSGNLAACLIVLRQGCLAMTDAPLLGDKQWQGLVTLFDILSDVLQVLEKNNPDASVDSFEVELTGIHDRVCAVQNQSSAWIATLAWLSDEGWQSVSQRLMELLQDQPDLKPAPLTELQLYLDRMHHQVRDMQRSLDLFAPWLGRLNDSLLQTPAGLVFRESLPVELPALGEAGAAYERIKTSLHVLKSQQRDEAAREWCQKLDDELSSAGLTINLLLNDFHDLAGKAQDAVAEMDFRFLFDQRRQIFHVGYNVNSERLDSSYYDLLASEARIASLIAIAKGDVPQNHWQHLGRPITGVNGKQVLLSWSGTMFEYLMPALFAKNYAGTFLSDSCYSVLDAQRRYGQAKKVPWGISESGYFAFDINMNYQYRAFGVPDLGYKRDLPDDLVVTPYASLLGLSLQPQAVLENMAHLEQLNMLGCFGFYEALDYSATRLPEKQAIVQSYMAHHQGMILVAACNYLFNDVMVQRFHADPRIRGVELLLQEKIPQDSHLEFPHTDEPADMPPRSAHSAGSAPWSVPVNSLIPQVHVLAAGDTSVMITNAGGGYSQWREFALTRWQADSALDSWGTWIYLQDRESGMLWSATCQPSGCGKDLQVFFYPHKVEFRRWDNGISLHTEITVARDGVEIRRVSILNDSDHLRKLKLTSYGEVVLATQAADRRHPAFHKLFIESEYLPRENALLFQRRQRSADDPPVFLVHALIIEAGRKATGGHESDRTRFLGRSRTIRNPLALQNFNSTPAGTVGGTLDPILSLGQSLDLKPYGQTRITFLTLADSSRSAVLEKLSRYRSGQAILDAFDEARARNESELLEQGLTSYTVENIQRILSALMYSTGVLRAAPHILAQNKKGQSGLWAFGISGDYPILLVRIRGAESPLVREALQAYLYWRSRHITMNLVILNEQDTGYALDLHNAIHNQIRQMGADGFLNQRDGIFILRTDQLQRADVILFQTAAGVILDEKNGTLADHASRLTIQPIHLPEFTPSLSPNVDPEPTPPLLPPDDLFMDNGLGGFSRDGMEYVIHLQPGQRTPHPWVNVIANPQFGFLVSESGLGCTWAVHSGENRLTPWRNDPVTDMPGEAVYIRDEETGLVWSPTPMPAGEETIHIIRHGAGYSIFESQCHGLNQNLRIFAATDAPIKVVQLRLQNLWERPRRITVTYYAEWVLGTTRDIHQSHIIPEFDPGKNALLAANHFNSEFGERVAFLASSKKPHNITADRAEFLGRLGSMKAPAALGRIGLASAVNAGLDPCAAIQLHVDLAPGAVEEVFFLIGQGASKADSLALIGQAQTQEQIETMWQAVRAQWDDILNTVTVETPDLGMNLMLNRWLLYQTLACRLWGRTALYQSSGAFGFRDQLQDVLALLHARPGIARAHILEAARHQFETGDVLHWWNPSADRGVRTRFSDDLLWLPYVTAAYVAFTNDPSILRELIPFLKGEALKPGEIERYAAFEITAEAFSMEEHCRRALEKGSTRGAHGLPLMGSGDWNDGMNRIGFKGRGESVWLGWFLYDTLKRFASISDNPAPYLQRAEQLSLALETHAWDDKWYLRAFYDDGTSLGSHKDLECQIDSIAQSWAILSGAADPVRAVQALESVNQLLIKDTEQMVLLFAPPFDKSVRDPGYIKGYQPGVRENGGQYTHAAIWTAWAFAKLGQGDRAAELFRMLNPVTHADTPGKVARYKVEPYVIAADIYSQPAHIGMGGWTWYTGSSSWMYRLGLEAILGISRAGNALTFNPCIPGHWTGFNVDYRFGTTHYKIRVENPNGVHRGVQQVTLDGRLLAGHFLSLADDGRPHDVRVFMG